MMINNLACHSNFKSACPSLGRISFLVLKLIKIYTYIFPSKITNRLTMQLNGETCEFLLIAINPNPILYMVNVLLPNSVRKREYISFGELQIIEILNKFGKMNRVDTIRMPQW